MYLKIAFCVLWRSAFLERSCFLYLCSFPVLFWLCLFGGRGLSLLVTIMPQLHLLQVFMACYVLWDLEPVLKLVTFCCSYNWPKAQVEQGLQIKVMPLRYFLDWQVLLERSDKLVPTKTQALLFSCCFILELFLSSMLYHRVEIYTQIQSNIQDL